MYLTSILLVSVLVFAIFSLPDGFYQRKPDTYWETDKNLPDSSDKTPKYLTMDASLLPQNFDWRNINGNVLVTPVRNQFVPRPCGSCWAHAATGALSDRVKIMQYLDTGSVPLDINLSPQYLLDCGMQNSGSGVFAGSCYGGYPYLAYKLIKETGISDESCDPYIGSSPSHFSEVACDEMMCRTCDRFGTCYLADPQIKVFVDEYGQIDYRFLPENITMVEAMMNEIYNNGPIVCAMYAHGNSFENYTSGIIVDNTTYNGITHDLVLLGWGFDEESQLDYWIGRNSFGTLWGENGFFYAQKGVNIFNMEQFCFWGTPLKSSIPTKKRKKRR